jgi:hypothetical protein
MIVITALRIREGVKIFAFVLFETELSDFTGMNCRNAGKTV